MDLVNDAHVRAAAGVVGAVFLASAATRLLAPRDADHPVVHEKKARALVQQAHSYAQMARQDGDSAVALQHATQSLAYLDVALQLVDPAALQRGSDIDIHVLGERVRKRQAAALEQLRAPAKSQAAH